MASEAWKSFERLVATCVGGERRGANTSRNGVGRSDIIHEILSTECKHLKSPQFGDLVDALKQAESAANHEGGLPVAVVGQRGKETLDAVVCMRLEVFRELIRRVPAIDLTPSK